MQQGGLSGWGEMEAQVAFSSCLHTAQSLCLWHGLDPGLQVGLAPTLLLSKWSQRPCLGAAVGPSKLDYT